MDANRFKLIRELFDAALDVAPDLRSSFLRERCGADEALRKEVERLLAAREKKAPVLDSAAASHLISHPKDPASSGQVIGDYKLLRQIGHGGMGAVYLAERADGAFHRQVAVKILRSATATQEFVRRFRQERQILASLDHPNIARLFEGGSTPEGLPYFILEYVEGEPITHYCDSHRLSVSARIRLFETVCSAVQSAHQKLIVHRDIKPGNILVTSDGTVKLLDFGIAKLIGQSTEETAFMTHHDMRVMTPEYASPEQIEGNPITTATDVYQLGVVLYELLTGRRPYQTDNRSFHEIVRAICEQEPTRPSDAVHTERILTSEQISEVREGTPAKLRRRLTGDLDTILLKALRKSPDRRYASVEQFAADLRRHLEGRPVTARPDKLTYRARRFLRRNALAAGIGALAACLLIGGFFFANWQAAIARGERSHALAERRRADEHASRAQQAQKTAEIRALEADLERREADRQRKVALLERSIAQRRFEDLRQLSTGILLEVHDEISTIAGGTRARESLVRNAMPYLDRLARESANDAAIVLSLAAAYIKLGDLQGRPFWPNIGDPVGAVRSYETALKLLGNSPARSSQQSQQLTARVYERLTSITPPGEKKRAYAFQALALAEKLYGSGPDVLENMRLLSVALRRAGAEHFRARDFDGAQTIFERSLELANKIASHQGSVSEDKHHVSDVVVFLGDIEIARGRSSKGLELHRRGLNIIEELLKVEPSNAHFRRGEAGVLRLMGDALMQSGQPQQAIESAGRAITVLEQLAALDTRNAEYRIELADHYQSMAGLLVQSGRREEALQFANKAIAGREKLLEEQPENTLFQRRLAESYTTGAFMLMHSKQETAATELRKKALNLRRRLAVLPQSSSEDLRRLAQDLSSLSVWTAQQGDKAEARKQLDESIRIFERLRSSQPRNLDVIRSLVSAEWAAVSQAYNQNDWLGALNHLRKVEAVMAELGEKATVTDLLNRASVVANLGYSCFAAEQYECAEESLNRAMNMYASGYANAPDAAIGLQARSEVMSSLAAVHLQTGKQERAEQLAAENLQNVREACKRDPTSQAKRVVLARVLTSIGSVMLYAGKYEKVAEHAQEAANILKSVAVTNTDEFGQLAFVQRSLGALYEALDLETSLAWCRAAMETLARANLPAQSAERFNADLHGYAGDVLWQLGRKDKAIAEYKLWRSRFTGEEPGEQGFQKLAAGARLNRLGEHDRALKMLLESEKRIAREKMVFPFNLVAATLYAEIGRAHLALASLQRNRRVSWSDAETYLSRAHEIYTAVQKNGKLPPSKKEVVAEIEAEINRCRSLAKAGQPH